MDKALITVVRVTFERGKELYDGLQANRSGSPAGTNLSIAKLEVVLSKLKEDILNYLKCTEDPDIEEISSITSFQLSATELICELKLDSNRNTNEKNTTRSGKLPEMILPEFEGDVLQWCQFWDQFKSNIDNRAIDDVDKLLYLKSCLKGQAKQAIEGLATTNKNYDIAVKTLQERYGKTSKVIDAHYSALNKIQPAENSTEEYRRVLNEIERNLQILKSLGENTTLNYLRFLIFEKFPEDLVYEVKLKLKENSIDEIRTSLEEIITAREEACKTGTICKENFTTQILYTQATYDKKRKLSDNNVGCSTANKRMKCSFCNNSHYNDQCRNYSTIKQRLQRLRGKCYKCFSENHLIRNCPSRKSCYYCKEHKHNSALCPTKFENKEETTETTNSFLASVPSATILQTACIKVNKLGETCKIKCRALLDSGSQRSYITQRLKNDLKLKTEETNKLLIYTFGSTKPQEITSEIVTFEVAIRDKVQNKSMVIMANVIPSITHSVPYTKIKLDEKYPIFMADDGSLQDQVDILIGNDFYFSIIATDKIKVEENLYLVDSLFGWIVSGNTKWESTNLKLITYFQSNTESNFSQPDLPLKEEDGCLKELWSLETIGICDSQLALESRQEEAIKHFNATTLYADNRYHVSWPWIDYPPPLSKNFGLAVGRLKNLLKRLDTTTLNLYDQMIRNQIEKGIVEIVPDLEKNMSDHPIHYLPHHGVKQADKPIRIVYDASSKTGQNKSLNECLFCGPLMLEDLTGLIIKFRGHPFGICADVEKAFLQIGLQKTDRDVTRFLWLKNLSDPLLDPNLLHLRFCRVPFGVISSPFLLNATVKYHLNNRNQRSLANDIYVDNLVTGVETEEEALNLYTSAKSVFNEISMNLRDWSSNSNQLITKIEDSCKENTVKVLGLDWKVNKDTIALRFKMNNIQPKTKREMLRIIASVYDPCGLAAPWTLPAKLLIQQLWRDKVNWDTPVTEDVIKGWKNISENLAYIQNLMVKRYYFKDLPVKTCQIHCFTDASMKAYAAVVYIVDEYRTQSFVIGKSRLNSVKHNLSIPRLELLGALIGSRLIKYVSQFLQFNIIKQVLWTDSQIVIDWCNSDKLLPPFVARRVEEIRKNKELVIRHVPSEMNPADVATRSESTLEEKNIWITGPKFLSENPNTWPTLINESSSFLVGEGLANETDMNALSTIKKIQSEYFQKELNNEQTSLKRNLGIFKDIDGVLRCKGRLTNTGWPYDKRYPILIPKNCDFTNRIIMDNHMNNYHVGAGHTLSILREKFWIPQGRTQVQKVIRKCTQCIKHSGGPFKLPSSPALPPERVNYSSPFTFTGVDYLGPVVVKTDTGMNKRWICLFTCLAVRAIHLELVNDLTAAESLLALRRMISTRNVPSLIVSDNATNFKLISTCCTEMKIKWRFIPQLAPWYGGFYERLIGIVKECMKRTLGKHLLTDTQLCTVMKEIEAVVNSRPLTYVDAEMSHILKPADFLAMGRTLICKIDEQELQPHGTSIRADLIAGWKRGLIVLKEFKEMFINRYLTSLRERYSHNPKQSKVNNMTPAEGQIVQIKGDSKNREEWKVGKITSLLRSSDNAYRVAKVRVDDKEFTRSIAQLYPLEIEETEENARSSNNEEPENTEPLQTVIEESESEEIVLNPNEKKGTGEPLQIQTEMPQPKNKEPNIIPIKEPGVRPKRTAATKALEKIRQWTQSLLALF